MFSRFHTESYGINHTGRNNANDSPGYDNKSCYYTMQIIAYLFNAGNFFLFSLCTIMSPKREKLKKRSI